MSAEIRTLELTPEVRAMLASVPLLATLEGDALDAGLSRCTLREVPPAVRIVEEGEYESCFYVIVSGRCEVAKQETRNVGGTVAKIIREKSSDHLIQSSAKKNRTKTLGSLKTGDWFGELACMSPWPRSSTVFSTGTTSFLQVNKEVFDDWMEASEGFRQIMEEAYMSRGLISLLRALDAFAVLGDDVLRELLEGATVESYKRGTPIVTQGEEGDAFYVIRGGVVSVSVLVEEELRTVSYLRAGNYFGEMALLDGEPRNATVTATNQTEVIKIDREKFLKVIAANPSANQALQRKITERLRAGEAMLGDAAMTDALTFMAGQGILEGTDVLVVDLAKCIYCGNCEQACASSHKVSLISLHGPTHKAFLFPTACRNCDDPLCLKHCPVDAIARDRAGEVKIADHCIGCGGCAVNCPYDTISMQPISEEAGERARKIADFKKPVTQQANKCDLCEDIASGPQCVQSCPTRAILRFEPQQLVKHILKQS